MATCTWPSGLGIYGLVVIMWIFKALFFRNMVYIFDGGTTIMVVVILMMKTMAMMMISLVSKIPV